MATLPKLQGLQCQFYIGWVGKCPELTDNGWCTEHEHLKCCVCGEKATRSCEQTMGALACGAHLCDNCVHVYERGGIHVSNEKAKEISDVKKKEEEETIKSRETPVPRLNEDGVPMNLFEMLKQPDGYVLQEIYYLELVHGLMGFFPALVGDNERIAVSTDKELIKKVWGRLERLESAMENYIAYVKDGFAYQKPHRNSNDPESIKPIRLLTEDDFNSRCAQEIDSVENPAFRWALGLIGGRTLSEEEFKTLIEGS